MKSTRANASTLQCFKARQGMLKCFYSSMLQRSHASRKTSLVKDLCETGPKLPGLYGYPKGRMRNRAKSTVPSARSLVASVRVKVRPWAVCTTSSWYAVCSTPRRCCATDGALACVPSVRCQREDRTAYRSVSAYARAHSKIHIGKQVHSFTNTLPSRTRISRASHFLVARCARSSKLQ